MLSPTMTSPSARRSLTRAEDEPITLKEKACRPVCRRQSVMIEPGNPLFAVTHVTRKATDLLSRTKSPRGRSPSGKMARLRCNDYLKGTCTNHSVKSGILQNACSTSPKMDADLVTCALVHSARLTNSLARSLKKR